MWQRRDLALLFAPDSGPPGFEIMTQRRGKEWLEQNKALLGHYETVIDHPYAAIPTAVVGEGARTVVATVDRQQAEETIDAALTLMGSGLWHPSDRTLQSTTAGTAKPSSFARQPVFCRPGQDTGWRHRMAVAHRLVSLSGSSGPARRR